jgi:hypothetical protein
MIYITENEEYLIVAACIRYQNEYSEADINQMI